MQEPVTRQESEKFDNGRKTKTKRKLLVAAALRDSWHVESVILFSFHLSKYNLYVIYKQNS